MTSIALIVIVAIVAIVFLGLGMAISNNNRRSQAPEHRPHTHSHRGGWGAGAVFLAIVSCLFAVAVAGWTSVSSVTEVQQATAVAVSPQSRAMRIQPPELARRPTPAEVLPSDEALVGTTEPEAVAPAAGGSDSDSGESLDPIEQIATTSPYDSAESTTTIETAAAETSSISPPGELNFTIWAVTGAGFACVAILIVAGIWIAHRRQHWSLSGMARSTVRSLWVVPMLASVGWVGYLIWPHLSIKPLERNTAYHAAQHEFPRYLDEPQSYFVPSTSELPSWITDGITQENDLVHVPVCGGWSVSEDETRNEARQQALRTIREDFSLTYPSAKDWRFDMNLDDFHAICSEYVETKSITYGISDPKEELTYRTHLLVELSDNVRGKLVNRWEPELQEYRMGMLLTFGGLLSLVCFAGAACLNLDLRTEGHYRRWLRTATVLVVVAAAAVAHGVLNSLWFQHSV